MYILEPNKGITDVIFVVYAYLFLLPIKHSGPDKCKKKKTPTIPEYELVHLKLDCVVLIIITREI